MHEIMSLYLPFRSAVYNTVSILFISNIFSCVLQYLWRSTYTTWRGFPPMEMYILVTQISHSNSHSYCQKTSNRSRILFFLYLIQTALFKFSHSFLFHSQWWDIWESVQFYRHIKRRLFWASACQAWQLFWNDNYKDLKTYFCVLWLICLLFFTGDFCWSSNEILSWHSIPVGSFYFHQHN